MPIIDDLVSAKARKAPRIKTKVNRWLERNPDKAEELKQAIRWFLENKTHDFGWEDLSRVLVSEWPDFPAGNQHLPRWAKENMSELAHTK